MSSDTRAPASIPAQISAPIAALTLCTIADHADSVLRIADCLDLLPPHTRTDLQMSEAVAALKGPPPDLAPPHDPTPAYDLILFALQPQSGSTLLEAPKVIETAATQTRLLVVLCDARTAARLSLPGNARWLAPGEIRKLPRLLARAREVPRPGGAGSTTARRPLAALLGRFGGAPPAQTGPEDSPLDRALAKSPTVIAFQGLSGGVGTTTLSVNLACQLAQTTPRRPVCLIDLNLQFGNAATYLDLPENSRILDAYLNPAALDADSFEQCLMSHGRNLMVFAAPDQLLPFDAITGADVARLIGLARTLAPVVVIDMPHTVQDWSGTVFAAADQVVCVASGQISAVRNGRLLQGLLQGNGDDPVRLSYALNRAPLKPSPAWQARLKDIETGLNARITQLFADGGPEVAEACDAGVPLYKSAPSNPLSKNMHRLAQTAKKRHPAERAKADV